MKVLVSGANGTLGRPVVHELVARGHDVIGLTRSELSAREIRAAGATPVIADLLDVRALVDLIAPHAPGAIVGLLSARPRDGLTRLREFAPSIALWTVGASNLITLSKALDIDRLIGVSVIFAYGYGDHGAEPLDEGAPTDGGAVVAGQARSLGALRLMEDMFLAGGGLVLRLGLLYGWQVPSTRYMAQQLRAGKLRLPGGGKALLSWLEVNDAARATADALELGKPGEIYNVAADEPATFAELASELAHQLEVPPPRSIPLWLARLARPHAASYIGATRLVVDSGKARRELRWIARYPTIAYGVKPRPGARPISAGDRLHDSA